MVTGVTQLLKRLEGRGGWSPARLSPENVRGSMGRQVAAVHTLECARLRVT
jgi:hypothetical protein